MSRYFFHIVDDHGRVQDQEGAELASDHLAKVKALEAARALLWCGDPEGRCAQNWRMEVADAAGQLKFDFLIEYAHEPRWLTL